MSRFFLDPHVPTDPLECLIYTPCRIYMDSIFVAVKKLKRIMPGIRQNLKRKHIKQVYEF